MEKLHSPRLPQEFILDAFADPKSVRDVVRGILHTIFFHRYFPTITPQTHEVLDLTLPYVAEPELETLIDQRTATLMRELDAEKKTHSLSSQSQSQSSQSQQSQQSQLSQQSQSQPPSQQSQQPQQAASSLQKQARAVVGGFLGGGGAGAALPWGSSGGGGGGGGGGTGNNGGGGGGGGRGQISVQFMEKTRRRKMWYRGDEEVCWESWTIRVTVAEPRTESERAKVRKAMESTLLTTVMKIITSVNTYKDHIPPITTTETNPFPYSITVNQKEPSSGGGAAAAAGGGGGGGGWGGRFGGLY